MISNTVNIFLTFCPFIQDDGEPKPMEYPSLGGVQEKVSTEVSLGKNRIFLISLFHMIWFKFYFKATLIEVIVDQSLNSKTKRFYFCIWACISSLQCIVSFSIQYKCCKGRWSKMRRIKSFVHEKNIPPLTLFCSRKPGGNEAWFTDPVWRKPDGGNGGGGGDEPERHRRFRPKGCSDPGKQLRRKLPILSWYFDVQAFEN